MKRVGRSDDERLDTLSPAMPHGEGSEDPWRECRRSERAVRWLIVSLLPVYFAVHLTFVRFIGQSGAFFIVMPIWTILYGTVYSRWMAFKCPRCGKPFFCTSWSPHQFTRECVHCGLPKWMEHRRAERTTNAQEQP